MNSIFKNTGVWGFLMGISVFMIACGNNDNEMDASGTFESVEVMAASEVTGKVISLQSAEGSEVHEGDLLGIVDSTQLYLKKKQLLASIAAINNRKPDVRKQLAVIQQQLKTARSEKQRIDKLLQAGAVNEKQKDDVQAQIAVLEKQADALQTSLNASSESISSEEEALRMQLAQLQDQLDKCKLTAPVNGTVLMQYIEKGEIVIPGKPLFKIANLSEIYLKAWFNGAQLSEIKTGQQVKVFSDAGEDNFKEYPGVITWISSESEFTPKTIQSRDERSNLVYAVKIRVKNDGFLKIGMYGGVKLK